MLARQYQQPVREIAYRTRAPITRLMSPGDLEELLKPFVFFDLFVSDTKTAVPSIEMGWHPHSGIATDLANYSVRTRAEALRRSEAEIRRIGRQFHAEGTLRRSPVELGGPTKARQLP